MRPTLRGVVLRRAGLACAGGVLLALAILSATSSAQQRTVLDDGWTIARAGPDGGRPADEAFGPATVPGTFERDLGPDFDGVAWYRRELALPGTARDDVVRLEFHGAATAVRVYLNGVPVGAHLGAWTPFRVELQQAARFDGHDLLEVELDEKVGHNTQGFLPIIQPHFGGLWQQVVLCVDAGPVLDRFALSTFGAAAGSTLAVEAPLLPGPVARDVDLRVAVLDGASTLAATSVRVPGALDRASTTPALTIAVPSPRPWSPDRPHLYRVELTLADPGDGRVLDRVVRRVGFRAVEARGTSVYWNGRPVQLRGMLHWGFEPPGFAPNPDPAIWRRELEDLRQLGCNMVKCCLWVPPTAFFDIADEVGLIVWQEYPTWHPTLTAEFLPDLAREYDEFYRHDRSHVSVGFRSLTCETGHSAEESVLRALYDRAHELVPETLVVDDSAWISWHRVHDFYDDHPYGNNREWPDRLRGFKEHIAARRALPLLFGECIASDTWFDLRAWQDAHAGDGPWWRPLCLQRQREFEASVELDFGRETLDALLPDSLAYALRNRKYQVERLRLDIPDAGYVLSVIRDFPKARMGFFDDLDGRKWSPADWRWHGDTMLCLATDGDRRAFPAGVVRLPVRVSHFGRGRLDGQLEAHIEGTAGAARARITLAEGELSEGLVLRQDLSQVRGPARFRLSAELRGTHPAANHWDFWVFPEPRAELPPAVRQVDHLDRDTLDHLCGGGRVLLRAGPQKRSLATEDIWYLKGAPFAPPHPIHASLPRDFLIELQTFDLEQPRVMQWGALRGQVDPILAFWDTHDVPEVNSWLFAFSCRVGSGRLLATALDHESPAGRFVLERFADWLENGPDPRRALSDATIEALRQTLDADIVDLAEWQLAADPDDVGLERRYQDGIDATAQWVPVRAGLHWERQGFEHHDGVGWYRTVLAVPERWRGKPVHAVFEGVDDSYRLYVDGREVARHGDPATGETVWLQRTVVDLGEHLRYGADNTLVLRVVDHGGAGGLHRPAWVTTGPVDRQSGLLH